MAEVSTRKKAAAVGAILFATMLWGTSFPVLKIALQAFTPLWFIGIRFFFAGLIMFFLCLPRLKKIDKSFLLDGLKLGLPVGFGYSAQTIGLLYTTAANNAFITATYVVIVPLLTWFTGKKVRGASFLIAGVTLAGLAVFSLSETMTVASGDIWTLACAFLFAVHIIILGRCSAIYDPLLLTMAQLFMISAVNLLLALFLEPLPSMADFTPTVVISLAYCIVFPSIICYLIQTWAQSILSPVTTSVLLMSEAVFGSIFGVLMLDESFGLRKLLGAAILLLCMTASVIMDSRPPKERAAAEDPVPK